MKDLINPQNWRHDSGLLLLLLALVVPLRGWMVYNTAVTARDSIGFMRYAQDIEHLGWAKALQENHQHPGYPLSIFGMSLPVRHYLGNVNSKTMQLSAQLASSLAAVLLIFPMYFLGKIFFERRIAFWGTLMLQFMPATGQHLSDGVSEALFLLMACSAFLFAVLALRKPTMLRFTLSGIFCGLAYMTRPEGAMILLATLAVLGIRQLVPFWRLGWRQVWRGALAMTVAGLAVGSAYFGFTGKFSNKPSVVQIIHQEISATPEAGASGHPRVLFATLFGGYMPTEGPLANRVGQALYLYGSEGFQLFHYGGFVSMLLGVFARVKRLLRSPEFLLPSVFFCMHSALLMGLALKAGYISDRHLMSLAIWGAYFAAAGLVDVPHKMLGWFAPLALNRSGMVSQVLLIGFMAVCMPRTVQKLHASQAGNLAAGMYLKNHASRGDKIVDDHDWSHFYSEISFQDGRHAPRPDKTSGNSYTVVTRSRDPKQMVQQRLQEERLRAAHAQIVFHWPETATVDQARIVIYAAPGRKN